MKLAAMLTTLSLVPAGARAAPRVDLVAVSRAMSAIDLSAQRDQLALERKQRAAAAAAQPRDPAARFLALYASPRDEETWSGFRALASDFPASALGHLGMARVYLDWGTLDQAEAEFDRALAVEPDNWITLRLRALAAERLGRHEQARADEEAVLKADPECAEAHLGLARVALKSNDPATARGEAERALALSPENAPALALLAELTQTNGDKQKAADLLGRAAKASPRDREWRIALARLRAELGDPRGALDDWKRALTLREDPESLRVVADLSRQLGDTAAERGALERLAQIDPAPAATWRRLAELRSAGDPESAETAWRQFLARNPRDDQGHLALARLLRARGDSSGAVSEYRAAGEASAAERAEVERELQIVPQPRGSTAELQRNVNTLLERAYRQRLREVPSLSGALRLRVAVDGAGDAAVIEVLEDTIHDDAIRCCVYWNLKDAKYPENRPGRYLFNFALRRKK